MHILFGCFCVHEYSCSSLEFWGPLSESSLGLCSGRLRCPVLKAPPSALVVPKEIITAQPHHSPIAGLQATHPTGACSLTPEQDDIARVGCTGMEGGTLEIGILSFGWGAAADIKQESGEIKSVFG